jgi:hypothetical protein
LHGYAGTFGYKKPYEKAEETATCADIEVFVMRGHAGFIEQVVASASLLTEDILKSGTQRRYFIPSTSKRKERLLKPKVVAVEA